MATTLRSDRIIKFLCKSKLTGNWLVVDFWLQSRAMLVEHNPENSKFTWKESSEIKSHKFLYLFTFRERKSKTFIEWTYPSVSFSHSAISCVVIVLSTFGFHFIHQSSYKTYFILHANAPHLHYTHRIFVFILNKYLQKFVLKMWAIHIVEIKIVTI